MPRMRPNTVTAGLRIILPMYPVLAGWIGLAYLLGDPARTATPSFQIVQNLMPMQGWGAVFLALMLVEAGALITGHRRTMVAVLYSGAMAWLMWSIGFGIAALTIDDASLNGPMIYIFIAATHAAGSWSLLKEASPRA